MTWKNVKTDGYPPCDSETVYVGVNSNGYCGCFNSYFSASECCAYETAERVKIVMDSLEWWQELELPK